MSGRIGGKFIFQRPYYLQKGFVFWIVVGFIEIELWEGMRNRRLVLLGQIIEESRPIRIGRAEIGKSP